MSVHIFGIRHHGPGCARSLSRALEQLDPDILLIEGPPDAEEILPLISRAAMKPPVAILIYVHDEPQRAGFFPFAEFSPEWQALQYAQQRNIPVRFMDLPQRIRTALEREMERERSEADSSDDSEPSEVPAVATPTDHPDSDETEPTLHDDPLGALAIAAGYRDRELWWEHQIEQRQDPAGLFEGIMEAMTALRTDPDGGHHKSSREFEVYREAHMRQTIRKAQREKFERIAVICGAWHAPALAEPGPAKPDQQLLKGLPTAKVVATWVPWTYSRLSYRSGYGAGIASPGWYEHLWRHPGGDAATHWVTRAARLMRREGLDASSASIIEAVRLADSLAALRDLPMPGLAELNEAVRTVLCAGDPIPLKLIRNHLEIGNRLGEVPEETPAVPLQRDLETQQKRLRLKPSTAMKTLDLDLRQENGRARSHLLHRLRLLGIEWGVPLEASGKSGTFHEFWELQWQVEFVVQLIEASIWGNTVEAAAANAVSSRAGQADSLPTLTEIFEGAILADLPAAVERVLQRLQEMAAVSADVRHLMDALPALARVARYGDVRGTRPEQLLPVILGMLERIVIGLVPACASLDDEAADRMVEHIASVQQGLDLLNLAEQRAAWQQVLWQLLNRDSVHGLVRGWSCRLLLEQRAISNEELHRRARLALSPAVPAMQAATWLEGLLRGSGLVLLHEDALWIALDDWLRELTDEMFIELLPLLRRAFSGFESPERRAMGEKVKNLRRAAESAASVQADAGSDSVNADRARLVLPVLAQILGVAGETIESTSQKD